MSQTLFQFMRHAGLPIVNVPSEMGERVIHGAAIDSRRIQAGWLFIALQGEKEHGLAYANQAIQNGAAAIFYEGDIRPEVAELGIPTFAISDLRRWAGPLLHAVYGLPGNRLFKMGITGTNGKTTITRLCSALMTEMGHRVIRLGTIDYAFGETILPSPLTTPGPDQFFEILVNGLSNGCTALGMEVSSHALAQSRVKGVVFDRAIFTNLTQDHLDFHKDMEDYFQAKSLLFSSDYLDGKGVAIVNVDSPYGVRIVDSLKQRGHASIITFSQHQMAADVRLLKCELSLSESVLTIGFQEMIFEIRSLLIGAINVENLLAAVSFGLSMGMNGKAIAAGLQSVSVPGRNELLPLPFGAFAVVDYAHTPDALERVLQSLRPLTKGRLHCVFGCGGDRDKTKRPIMGKMAAQWSDSVIVTSDNPRTENPQTILSEIVAGISSEKKVEIVADRREAIVSALGKAKAGDCVLIAGKGHEDYQILGKVKHPFSDQNVVRDFIQGLGNMVKGEG